MIAIFPRSSQAAWDRHRNVRPELSNVEALFSVLLKGESAIHRFFNLSSDKHLVLTECQFGEEGHCVVGCNDVHDAHCWWQ